MFGPGPRAKSVTCEACGATYLDDPDDWSGDQHPERECIPRRIERETIARVVAWLRAEAAKHDGPMPGVDPVGSVLVIADAIERGDWRDP